ncbi:unnamed protein product, partial [Rotaria sp. Silwood1]
MFVWIKDYKENIIPCVQYIKCLSIFVYETSKTDSTTPKAHTESCLGDDSPSSSSVKNVSIEACAKFCPYDLRP